MRMPLSSSTLFSRLFCFGPRVVSTKHEHDSEDQVSKAARHQSRPAKSYAERVENKEAEGLADCARPAVQHSTATAVNMDGSTSCSSSSVIPALYAVPKRAPAIGGVGDMVSCDAPSTSYPTTSLEEEWDLLGVCMTTAQEMEACVDAVLEGSIKSAQALFARYDMDLDQQLQQQDLYDLMLELALALPYQEYQRFIDACFAYADSDRDGFITLADFVPLYKTIAAVRRAFRRQDHHSNGQIDRYDFYQLLLELKLEETQDSRQQLQDLADDAFSIADVNNRGIVNFGQTLVWFASYLLATSKRLRVSSRQLLEQLEQQQWQ